MKKLLVLLLVVAVLLPCFASALADDVLKVALVLPGKKDDVSFNQAMYRGMMDYYEAHSDEIDLQVVENVYDVSDIEPTLIEFAEEG